VIAPAGRAARGQAVAGEGAAGGGRLWGVLLMEAREVLLNVLDFRLHLALGRVVPRGSSAILRQVAAVSEPRRVDGDAPQGSRPVVVVDRKSTRLNSSHVKISYAVFCLKKKTR